MFYQSASAMKADRATARATGLFSEPEKMMGKIRDCSSGSKRGISDDFILDHLGSVTTTSEVHLVTLGGREI